MRAHLGELVRRAGSESSAIVPTPSLTFAGLSYSERPGRTEGSKPSTCSRSNGEQRSAPRMPLSRARAHFVRQRHLVASSYWSSISRRVPGRWLARDPDEIPVFLIRFDPPPGESEAVALSVLNGRCDGQSSVRQEGYRHILATWIADPLICPLLPGVRLD